MHGDKYFAEHYEFANTLHDDIIAKKYGDYDVSKLTTEGMSRSENYKYKKALEQGIIAEEDRIFYEHFKD